jgi:hypothetical protein
MGEGRVVTHPLKAYLESSPIFDTQLVNREVTVIVLGDDVTCCGGAQVFYNEDASTYDFTIELGPVNAKKLIEFLQTLPGEPEDETVESKNEGRRQPQAVRQQDDD